MASPHTIAIVATGPSVLDVDLAAIEADVTIAVNGAIELLKPDIWFSLDPSPINRFRVNNPVDGVKYVVAFPDHASTPKHVTRLKRVSAKRGKPPSLKKGAAFWMWRWSAMKGLSEDPDAIHTGNSAYGALGLAYHLRPRKIILYGVDGTQEARATGGQPRCLDHLPKLFASAIGQLREAHIEVYNASPRSRITCFQNYPLTKYKGASCLAEKKAIG